MKQLHIPREITEMEAIEKGAKQCTVCLEMLPLNMFQKQTGKPLGLKYKCKKCAKEYDHKRYLIKKEWHGKLTSDTYKENREERLKLANASNKQKRIHAILNADDKKIEKKKETEKVIEKWQQFKQENSNPDSVNIEIKPVEEAEKEHKRKIEEAKRQWENFKKEKQNNLEKPL